MGHRSASSTLPSRWQTPVGGSWQGAAYRDIYFKVLPLGTASVPGCLIWFPALDVSSDAPGALGWRVTRDSHFMENLGSAGVALPRGELRQRERHQAETRLWREGDASANRGPGMAYLSEDQVSLLRFSARSLDAAEATYQHDAFALHPGEQAMVPVVWEEPPAQDFACQIHDEAPAGLEALESGAHQWDSRHLLKAFVQQITLIHTAQNRV